MILTHRLYIERINDSTNESTELELLVECEIEECIPDTTTHIPSLYYPNDSVVCEVLNILLVEEDGSLSPWEDSLSDSEFSSLQEEIQEIIQENSDNDNFLFDEFIEFYNEKESNKVIEVIS